jgi:hypothetical protein
MRRRPERYLPPSAALMGFMSRTLPAEPDDEAASVVTAAGEDVVSAFEPEAGATVVEVFGDEDVVLPSEADAGEAEVPGAEVAGAAT